MENVAASRSGRGRWYLVAAVLLVLALLPFALIEGPGAGILNRLGWTDGDESFTELYFPDHLALPRTIEPGAPLAFDFSVRNVEGTTETYTWRVLVGSEPVGPGADSTAIAVADGETRLGHGEVAVVHIERSAPVSLGRLTVSVVLVDRDEAIHFPVTIEPPEPSPD